MQTVFKSGSFDDEEEMIVPIRVGLISKNTYLTKSTLDIPNSFFKSSVWLVRLGEGCRLVRLVEVRLGQLKFG